MPQTTRAPHLPLNSLDWGKLVKLVGEANAGVARFDGLIHGIPNPRVFLSPLITQEAVLSSRIEGTQATLQEVLRFEADEVTPPEKRNDIQEVLNYRRAMFLAEDVLRDRPITLTLIRGIHRELMASVRGRDKAPGAFRTEQNWIGSQGCTMAQARYVPPSPLEMRDALDNFESYLAMSTDDPLVQIAIAHAQFEIIHPFMDGNGRVGRILIPLYLLQRQLLRSPAFYVSEDLEARREEYYDRLLAITRDGDWEGWIAFFLEAGTRQAELNASRARRMFVLYEEMKVAFAKATRSQYVIQALDAAFSRAFFASTTFSATSGIPKATAARMLAQLVDAGLLRLVAEGSGRSPSVYAFEKLLAVTESK
jgi:Fic family protein